MTNQDTENANDYLHALCVCLSTLLLGGTSAGYPFCVTAQTHNIFLYINVMSYFQPVAWLPLVMEQHHSHLFD